MAQLDLESFQKAIEEDIEFLQWDANAISVYIQQQIPLEEEEWLSGLTRSEYKGKRRLSDRERAERFSKELFRFNLAILSKLKELDPENEEWVIEKKNLLEKGQATDDEFIKLMQRYQEVSTAKAKQALSQKTIRLRLCTALQSVSNDAFEIAKITTPILIALAVANTISLPLNSVLFGSIALFIARMSIASICVEQTKKDDTK